MLYVTTRKTLDAVTVRHALTEGRGAEDGLYVPMRLPKLSQQEVKKLSEMSFGQCVAEILNLFFSEKLSGWDIDFSVGRYPVRLEQMGHRIFMSETWHNLQGQYAYLERNLMELLHSETDGPGNWVSVSCRMAVLAGLLGNRDVLGDGRVDIAAVSGDFTVPISAWYLREMGFPIGNIICCCNENKQVWDLLCNGQMRTDEIPLSTTVPEADVALPVNLERLISGCGGMPEVQRYLKCCADGNPYSVSDPMLAKLRDGLYVSVVSSDRVETTIPNVFKTHQYVLSPASALAYSGLLDYRTKTGITRAAMFLSDQSPACDAAFVAEAMKLSETELKKLI